MVVDEAIEDFIKLSIQKLNMELELNNCHVGLEEPEIIIYSDEDYVSESLPDLLNEYGLRKIRVINDPMEICNLCDKTSDRGYALNSVVSQIRLSSGDNIFKGIKHIVLLLCYCENYIEYREKLYRVWNKDQTWDVFINADVELS